ncbi:MAG: electron transport complex subunit RsxC [Actinobacteria bacterium]|nr:electron transport complex subunit RsxC [Actinomycetota bacterium]
MSLLTFKGGVHPLYHKDLTESKGIKEFSSLPKEIIVPLQQHTGAPCNPLVEKGNEVLAGQKIGDSDAFISAPVHSSFSGKVTAVEPRVIFSGISVLSVVITPSEEQKKMSIETPADLKDISPDTIRKIVREAGIVGLGGAAFPTYVKLTPPKDKPIDSVIINGCECEPYLTCDHRNMLEYTADLILGMKIIMKAVEAKRGFFAIESNKMDAVRKVEEKLMEENGIAGKKRAESPVQIALLETKYPQGSEKHLIKAILNREIPSGGLPSDVGALVQNIGTTIAIARAIRDGAPLIERVITVTGTGISEPSNLRVKIGTLLGDVINECGGLKGDIGKVILGGPMTGFAQYKLNVPIVKGISGILVLPYTQVVPETIMHKPCIRCGRCVEACPMQLLPNMLGSYARVEMWSKVDSYHLFDCIECGCCAYVCPAKIPLVQLFRVAKGEILMKRKREAAALKNGK